MGDFFSYELVPILLNMSLTASVVIAAVLLMRLALRRAPRGFSCVLWLVVLFRLLCPVSLSTDISLLGLLDAPAAEATSHTTAVEYIPRDVVHTSDPVVVLPVPGAGEAVTEALPRGEEQTAADPLEAPVAMAAWAWLLGAAAMAGWGGVSLIRLRRRLVGAVLLEKRVYLADHIDTPFVLGLFRPGIYLPAGLPEEERGYILLHERQHIRHLDHVVKLLAFLALCIHWFNPLVWLFFVLLGQDMEMRCDEAVMRELGADVRADYSASLLRLATGRKILAGAPLAFGEGDTRARVKNVLRWKEPKVWLVILAAAAVLIAAAVCGTNGISESTVRIRQADGGIQVELTLRTPVRSYAVYEEIYQDGRLISGKPVLVSGFSEDDWGDMPYRHTFALRTEAERLPEGGFSGKLDAWCEEGGTVSHRTVLLPGTAYTGMGGVVGTGNMGGTLSGETLRLRAGGSAVLCTLMFSTKANGAICSYYNGLSLEKFNDTVVQYRLVTSAETAEVYEEMPLDLAQMLYDLRVESLSLGTAQAAVRTLLDAMGAAGCGSYELQYYDLSRDPHFTTAELAGAYWPGGTGGAPPYGKTGLVIWYDAVSDGAASRTVQRIVPPLLLALVPGLSEVHIGCLGPDGTAGYAGDSDGDADWLREQLGYRSYAEAGASAAGIRAMMALLSWPEDTAGGARTLPLTAGTPCAAVPAEGLQEVTTADIARTLASQTLPDGTQVLLYTSASGGKYCAYIPAGTQRLIRFTEESEVYAQGYAVLLYEDVLGRSGFHIRCPRGAAYLADDYYYFDEDGVLWQLAACGGAAMEADLGGDGQKELLWSYHGWELYLYTQINGRLYQADLCSLTAQALGYRRGEDVQVALEIPESPEAFAAEGTGYTLLPADGEDGSGPRRTGTIRVTAGALTVLPDT